MDGIAKTVQGGMTMDAWECLANAIVTKAVDDYRDSFWQRDRAKLKYDAAEILYADRIETAQAELTATETKAAEEYRNAFEEALKRRQRGEPFAIDYENAEDKYNKQIANALEQFNKEKTKAAMVRYAKQSGYNNKIKKEKDCESFFLSDWFTVLTAINGKDLLKKLQREQRLK